MRTSGSIAAIALVRILKKEEDKQRGDLGTDYSFYVNQSGKLDNACGDIALIHNTSVLNVH